MRRMSDSVHVIKRVILTATYPGLELHVVIASQLVSCNLIAARKTME